MIPQGGVVRPSLVTAYVGGVLPGGFVNSETRVVGVPFQCMACIIKLYIDIIYIIYIIYTARGAR